MDSEPESPSSPERTEQPEQPEQTEQLEESERVENPEHPRRTFGPRALLFVALISALATAGVAWFVSHTRGSRPSAEAGDGAPSDGVMYQCPMHPTIVQDHPGECPICGMRLVQMDRKAPSRERAIRFYRSPMDPSQTSPAPRKDEMGMDYLPVYEDEVGATPGPAGLATIEIDPARQQLIGLRTTEVTEGPVGGAWRTVARIAVDETRVRHVNLKVPGFVERVYADFVGKKVRRGDPLFSIYSPELLSTQQEYLLAVRGHGALEGDGGLVGGDFDTLVGAARRRLELWDVPASEIEALARTGEPQRTLTFHSPIAGVVTKKDVVEGMRLEAGAMPYEIVDLSSLWALADVYETELRFVSEGMAANLELEAFPNREFQGRVAFIDPLLDPRTRTLTVRLAFPNPTGDLRPGMFGEVVLSGSPHNALRIPPDAVVESGVKKIVFVAIGEGRFEPREVRLGQSDGSVVEILSGLVAGERVVTRANFLIDSESRLRASLAQMSSGTTTPAPPESAQVLPGVSAPLPPSTRAPTIESNDGRYAAPADHRGRQP